MEEFGGFPTIRGAFLGSHNKVYNILGFILGYPNFGKLPFKGWRVEELSGLLGIKAISPNSKARPKVDLDRMWGLLSFRAVAACSLPPFKFYTCDVGAPKAHLQRELQRHINSGQELWV